MKKKAGQPKKEPTVVKPVRVRKALVDETMPEIYRVRDEIAEKYDMKHAKHKKHE